MHKLQDEALDITTLENDNREDLLVQTLASEDRGQALMRDVLRTERGLYISRRMRCAGEWVKFYPISMQKT